MDTDGFLQQALIYLGAGIIAVPIFTRLGAGSVLGYLVAGIAIRPWGLRLITAPQTVLQFVALAFLGGEAETFRWIDAAKAIGFIAALVAAGRVLVRPALRYIAGTRLREVFVGFSLFLVLGTAALSQAVGLSMALGAFLAGVMLAESEYRYELELDIDPFKGLLLGLFFMAIGMSVDPGPFVPMPHVILA